MPENQISQTLFRFSTLRNPELVDLKDSLHHFVFPPQLTSREVLQEVFTEAISNLGENESHTNALFNTANEFTPLTEDQLKTINPSLYIFSDWIHRNRSTFWVAIFEEKLIPAQRLSTEDEALLWSNLYYHIITQKNFYAKELIIQLLVGNHIIYYKKDGGPRDYEPKETDSYLFIKSLVYANIVLPDNLFNSEQTQPLTENDAEIKQIATPDSIKKALEIASATHELNRITVAKEQIKEIEADYKMGYDEAYKIAKKEYDQITNRQIEEYKAQVKQAKDSWCQERGNISYDPNNPCDQPANISYPNISKFEFTHIPEIIASGNALIDDKTHPYNTLNMLMPIDRVKTFKKAYELLDKEESKLQNIIIENTDFSKKLINVNNTTIPLNTTILFNNECYIVTIKPYIYNPQDSRVRDRYWFFIVNIKSKTKNVAITNLDHFLVYSNMTTPMYETFRIGNKTDNDITVYLFGGNPILSVETNPAIQLNITLKNNDYLEILTEKLKPYEPVSFSKTCATSIPNEDVFIPNGYGIRQLGIADYRKVEQSIHCYLEGEVSHIENIMAREYKERSTRRFRSKQDTISITSEVEKEQLTDTTTTDRFEMQNEISEVIAKSKEFAANTSFSASYNTAVGSINLGAAANYATASSKEESINQAITKAQEITYRAMDRVVQRIKEERVTKIIEEYEENNKHGFDNKTGDKHVIGVYRWVDKVYKNQIYNYGKRLMYEFMIPQPSKLHRLALATASDTEIIEKPIDPRQFIKNSYQLNFYNYQRYAAMYNAKVDAYPDSNISIGKSFSFTVVDSNKDQEYDEVAAKDDSITIPEGYKSTRAEVIWSRNWEPPYDNMHVMVGDRYFGNPSNLNKSLPGFQGNVPISFSIIGSHVGNANIKIDCTLTTERIEQWQLETFEAIMDGYYKMLEEYNAKKAEAEEKAEKNKQTNPLYYRQIEQLVLRKNCISYLIDKKAGAKNTYGKGFYNKTNTFSELEINISPNSNLDHYTSFAKFIEQAFEWNIMSYNFYPFYWGDKSDWYDLYNFENNDPLFRSFMQAGMARVVLTVRPGFEQAVMHYMATGRVWNGGELPVLNDKLYLSITEELKQPLGQKEGLAWKTRVPTSLTILQADSLGLKVDKALPCNCENEDDFIEPDRTGCTSQISIEDGVFTPPTDTNV